MQGVIMKQYASENSNLFPFVLFMKKITRQMFARNLKFIDNPFGLEISAV